MDRKEFGILVSHLRQDLNLTQFELAENAEVDIAVISQIERGVKKHLDSELLFKLAKHFFSVRRVNNKLALIGF